MLGIIRGDTQGFKFQRMNSKNEIITVKADEVIFTIKKNYNTNVVLIQKKLSDGQITFDDEAFYHFKLNSSDTSSLEYGDYVYDIQIEFDDEVKTVSIGNFEVKNEVTF